MSDANGNGTPPDGGQTPPAGDAGADQGQNQEPLAWDSWHAEQSDDVKLLLETHTNGLKTALNSERDARGQLESQVNQVLKLAGASNNAELITAVQGMQAELDKSTRKLNFLSDVGGSVTDADLAFIAAEQAGAFDKSGRVNIETLKAAHPTLFETKQAPPPPGNTGSGAGNNRPGGGGMSTNDRIRAAARRNRQ